MKTLLVSVLVLASAQALAAREKLSLIRKEATCESVRRGADHGRVIYVGTRLKDRVPMIQLSSMTIAGPRNFEEVAERTVETDGTVLRYSSENYELKIFPPNRNGIYPATLELHSIEGAERFKCRLMKSAI